MSVTAPSIVQPFFMIRSGTLRNTRLNISCAKSTDSSMAWLVGITRTLTCFSLARIGEFTNHHRQILPRRV